MPVIAHSLGGTFAAICAVRRPDLVAFQLGRWLDLAACLTDPAALGTYLRVLRWTMDEFRLPTRLFVDVVELVYRDDALLRSTLDIEGQRVGPADLIAPMGGRVRGQAGSRLPRRHGRRRAARWVDGLEG